MNHRTRIFAPDSTKKATHVKDYFVNNNGDVFITTKTPFVPKPTTSTNPTTPAERKNRFSPSTKPTNKPLAFNLKPNKKPFVPKSTTTSKNGLDLEPLLEEPIKNSSANSNNDDLVEVVKSKPTEGPTHNHDEVTVDYDYDTTLDPDYIQSGEQHEIVSNNSKETEKEDSTETQLRVQDPVQESIEEVDSPEIPKQQNSEEHPEKEDSLGAGNSQELHPEVEDQHGEDELAQSEENKAVEFDSQEKHPEEHFDDSKEVDHSESHEESEDYVGSEEHEGTSEEEAPKTSEENNDIRDEDYAASNEDETKVSNKTYEIVTTKPSTMVKDDNFQQFVDTTIIDNITEEPITTIRVEASSLVVENNKTDDIMDAPEVVVSVVTTKSVVNNTIIPSVTPLPTVATGIDGENSTDTWVVVASVQTSRSVSGARYLPSPNVEQDQRLKLLNEEEEEIETTTEEIVTTTLPPTTTKTKTSTESLIDKLDRVQSDLSSSLLTGGFNNEGNNIAVITENMSDKIATTMLDVGITSPEPPLSSSTTTKPSIPDVQIRKFSPFARPSTTSRPKKTYETFRQEDLSGLLPPGFKPKYQNRKTTTTQSSINLDIPQGDEPPRDEVKNSTTGRSSGLSNNTKITVQDVTAFLPPGYKPASKEKDDSSRLLAEILGKVKQPKADETQNKTLFDIIKNDNIAAFLPPGYKPSSTTPKPENTSIVDTVISKAKPDDISAFLPPGYKPPEDSNKKDKSVKVAKQDDISSFLPPGYKSFKTSTTEKTKSVESLLAKAKPVDDLSALLPPGFKPSGPPKTKGMDNLFAEAKPLDVSAFLPPGYKARTTQKPLTTVAEKVPPSLLPPGFKLKDLPAGTREITTSSTTSTTSTTSKPSGGGFKVVFPSRPGGGTRKSATRLTTPKASNPEEPQVTPPSIQKGWPSRFVLFPCNIVILGLFFQSYD